MTRTINLSNTQFRYQLVFFVDMFDFYNVIQQIKYMALSVIIMACLH